MKGRYAPECGRMRKTTVVPTPGAPSTARTSRSLRPERQKHFANVVETSPPIDAMGRHDGQRPSAVGAGMKVRSWEGCSVKRP
jgi:hypothetical protein